MGLFKNNFGMYKAGVGSKELLWQAVDILRPSYSYLLFL